MKATLQPIMLRFTNADLFKICPFDGISIARLPILRQLDLSRLKEPIEKIHMTCVKIHNNNVWVGFNPTPIKSNFHQDEHLHCVHPFHF